MMAVQCLTQLMLQHGPDLLHLLPKLIFESSLQKYLKGGWHAARQARSKVRGAAAAAVRQHGGRLALSTWIVLGAGGGGSETRTPALLCLYTDVEN